MINVQTLLPSVLRTDGAKLGLSVVAVVSGLLLFAAPASAKYTHHYEKSFGGVPFVNLAVSVDNSAGPSAGDVYVGGSNLSGSDSVVKFDQNGNPAGVEITGAETPQGSFGLFESFAAVSRGVAVDGSSGANAGDVYVADIFHGVIDRFSEEGKFLCQITGKEPAARSAAEKEAECAGATGSEVPGGGFSANGVAVNPVNGDVYVSDASHAAIDEFNPKGEYVGQITDSHITQPGSIAFSSTGELYVANGLLVGENVVKFDAAGAFVATIDSNSDDYVAVDPADNHVYVYRDGEHQVAEYDSSGALLTTFGSESETEFGSVAVSAATGKVYLTSLDARPVAIYGPGIIIPDVTTPPAIEVDETTATLKGTVDPAGGGDVETCQFEYVNAAEYQPGTENPYSAGQTAPCSPATPYASKIQVSAELSGLSASTTYHFRLSAANSNAVNDYTADATFITKGPPAIEEESASNVERNAATLSTKLNPDGYDTTYRFEYVDAQHYEAEGGFASPATRSTPASFAGSGQSPLSLGQSVGGLKVGTTYHYRAVATNSQGTVTGNGATFETLPVAGFESRGQIARITSATVEANINPLGLDTTCQVQYVVEAEFNKSGYANATTVPCTPADLGSGSSPQKAKVQLANLGFDSTYHYRFVLTNNTGTLNGPGEQFATFGISFSMEALNEAGEPETRAGGHPYELTTSIKLNTTISGGGVSADGLVKDILTKLPPGLIGNPTATPTCSLRKAEENQCSGDSQVGTITVEYGGITITEKPRPLMNVAPAQGKAASFALEVNQSVDAFIDSGIRTGGDYGITTGAHNITASAGVYGVTLTIWGLPASPSHTRERACPHAGHNEYNPLGCASGAPEKPLLSMPTSCTGPLGVEALADSYAAPGEFARRSIKLPALEECDKVHFEPEVEVRPSTSVADSPSGVHVDIHVPQNHEGPAGIEGPSGLRTADLKDSRIVLPSGFAVNPSGADGLTGCSAAQFDIHGEGPAACPDASKIGTVEMDSPLVGEHNAQGEVTGPHPLKGYVYLATPHENPFDSLIALYIGVSDPETGIVIKLAGHVQADPVTGQLTTTFDENPQLPFEELKLDFYGGPRAALATPPACGSYAAGASFASWAAPGAPVTPGVAPFAISTGPGGGVCPSGGFAPSFTAGMTATQAGAFAPFTLSFSRNDGEQDLSGLTVTLPEGLSAKLAGVPLCGEAEANAGTCGEGSRIGSASALAGAGSSPLYVPGGRVYLTTGYKGQPFGLSVVVPAVAGPFNLGNVVVRAAIHIDPATSQVTVISDPLPQIKEGVPFRLRTVNVSIDRSGFTFNPTNCSPQQITGTLTGAQGATVPVSSPFQVGNCANLKFAPKFSVSTQANSSKAGGASLRVKITSGSGQANLAQVKVDLPKQLPSRLSTLQKACLVAVFDANPAACPAGSLVGSVKAVTPLLKTPFTGPAYLVSHGSAGTPDLELVLQSEGVTLIQDGKTRIKNGITSSMFKAIPDAPISSIELTLPEGPHSALAAFLPAKAKYDMCGQKLLMPTQITGQNGAVIKQTTKITVTGCPKAKATKASKRHKAKKRA
jgi:hypothetical protein